MAWCTNPYCRKDGLRKADIEFCEETRAILCHGCYAVVHPGWIPPAEYVDLSQDSPEVTKLRPQMGFALQVTNSDIKAKVSYGSIEIAFQSPTHDLKRLFGV